MLQATRRTLVAATGLLVLVLPPVARSAERPPDSLLPAGLTVVSDYRFAALESEVAGIQPHPDEDDLFLVAVNRRPAYRAGEQAILDKKYRGRLLTIHRKTGAVRNSFDLGGKTYGGMAFANGVLYVSSLEPPEVLKVDLRSGAVIGRIPLSGPAGGLEIARGVLMAQMYVGLPHLALVDSRSGTTVKTLPSDENAMDLAVVGDELLCTWISDFGAQAFGELRKIDPASGTVVGRIRLPAVHTSMAALDPAVAGEVGFIALVRTPDASGRVLVRRYAYDQRTARW